VNRYLAVFLVVSFLAVASLVVYAKNSPRQNNTTSNQQELSKFDVQNQGSQQQVTQPMNQPQVTELKIEDIVEGTGSAVKAGDTAEVNYVGTLLDGRKFDSSYDRNQTFEFPVGAGRVIKGWDEGLVGMKVGGKRKLTIPSDMAYGPQGAGGIIGPNTPLQFEIELVSIK
jgi:FKBP-type peptidyl-prolyl cis-trans isomerase